MVENKRKFKRYKTFLNVECFGDTKPPKITKATMIDFTPNGFLLESDENFVLANEIKIKIYIPSEGTLTIKAIPLWSKVLPESDISQTGFRIVKAGKDDIVLLQKFYLRNKRHSDDE